MFAAPVSVNQYANRQARAPLADRQQTAGRSEPLGDVIGSVPQGYAPFSFAAPGRNVSLSVNPFIVAGGPPPLQTALPTARNIGAAPGAVGVYSGNSLDFKNLLAGSGISISSTSSNVIITATGATSAAFLQGGNAFGAPAVLGTTDNNRLIVKTDGITALTLNTDQSAQFAGALSVAGTATVGSPLIIQGATSGSLSLSVPSVVTSYAVTWPAAQGSGALTNNGAGSLSWVPSSSTAGVVNPSMSAAQIQAVISNPALNSVVFSPGTYALNAVLNVNRSNLVLEGNEAILTLTTNANCPVIFVGDMSSPTPPGTYADVTIRGFVINGNKANQSSEFWVGGAWITNCGISVSQCRSVVITGCDISNCRSGGTTITLGSSNVIFANCQASANFFDGLTCYGSSNCQFTNCQAYANLASGISIDDAVVGIIMTGNQLTGNTANGLFARSSTQCVFSNNVVTGNGQNGLFLSGYNTSPNDQNIVQWAIDSNIISGNTQQGLFLQSVEQTTIAGNTIVGNTQNGINMTSYSSTPQNGVSKYVNFSGNTVTGNLNVGFYNDASNSFGNGATNLQLSLNVIAGNTSAQVVGDLTAWAQFDATTLTFITNGGANKTQITAQNTTVNVAFALPTTDGLVTQKLTTNGAGVLSWS